MMAFGTGFGAARAARRRQRGYVMTVGQALPMNWSITRGSGGTRFDASGSLQSEPGDVARITYNRLTLALRGLLIEPAATNGIRNNTMQGAMAGSPGTLPTNWSIGGAAGLTRTIVGAGTIGGMEYIDIRFAGAASGTFTTVLMETASAIAAANGQTWTGSAYIGIVGGSAANISSFTIVTNVLDGGTAVLAQQTQTIALSATLNRLTVSGVISSASAAYVRPLIGINYPSGAALDITLRIALPQLEQGGSASSVIRTTGSAMARATETLTVSGLASYGLVSGATYPATIVYDDDTVSAMNLTIAVGAISLGGTGTKPIRAISIAPIAL